jgi:hypothetical protein
VGHMGCQRRVPAALVLPWPPAAGRSSLPQSSGPPSASAADPALEHGSPRPARAEAESLSTSSRTSCSRTPALRVAREHTAHGGGSVRARGGARGGGRHVAFATVAGEVMEEARRRSTTRCSSGSAPTGRRGWRPPCSRSPSSAPGSSSWCSWGWRRSSSWLTQHRYSAALLLVSTAGGAPAQLGAQGQLQPAAPQIFTGGRTRSHRAFRRGTP